MQIFNDIEGFGKENKMFKKYYWSTKVRMIITAVVVIGALNWGSTALGYNLVELLSKNKEFTPITAELIISNKVNTKKKFYKKIKINNSSINNLEINQLVDIYYEFDPYDKLYINIFDKNNANINKNINLVIIYFKNEINLKNFNIIDNFENCYYIKKK